MEVSLKLALEFENNSVTKGKRAVGAVYFDYAKYFDKLPWNMLQDLALHAGAPSRLVKAMAKLWP